MSAPRFSAVDPATIDEPSALSADRRRHAAGSRAAADARRRSLGVLLVEDDEDDYVIVADLLGGIPDFACQLRWVRTYEQGLSALADGSADVCLLDYRLGQHDGLELLQACRAQGSRTPVIIFTGHGGREVDVEAMRAGAEDYLIKGQLDADTLERSIRYAVERAQVLEALRRSEERSRQIVKATPIPMVVARTVDGLILFANDHFVRLLALDGQVGSGQSLSDYAAQLGGYGLEEARGSAPGERCQLRGQRTDGEPFWAAVTAEPISFEGQEAVLIGLYDLTEQKRAETQLVRLERLRVLGEIAAGVSHNLNNLLVGILGPAQSLRRKVEEPRLRDLADDIITSARRARDLVRRLHHPVRLNEEGLQPVDVNRVIEESVRAASPRWKDETEARGLSIQVSTRLAPGLSPVRATAAELQEVMTNLLFNAVDALPAGGAISVTTAAVGGGVELRVEDDGIGMDEETRRRAFEPLFTTKAEVGTGLGLYTVYTSVTRWGGSVEADSEPGAGARFTLFLPGWPGSRGAGPAGPSPPALSGPSHRGRLLVVDDDEICRKVLGDALSPDYDVVIAEGAAGALAQFARGRYDAVLIDLGMADVPGHQLAHRLRAEDPDLVTVLITGWDIGALDARAEPFDLRLQKPFSDEQQLRSTVSRAVRLHDARFEGRRQLP